MDSNHASATATAFGGLAGIFSRIDNLAFITWSGAIDTAIYAAIGGIVGWTVAEILKWAKSKLSKVKND